MEIKDSGFSGSGEDLTLREIEDKSSSLENIKLMIAEKLHSAAEELSQKASSSDLEPTVSSYERELSKWLDRSAEYVQHFDYERMNAKIREHVAEKPGLSLLLAGAAGWIIGALVRRR
ncbi:hypothetical protein [Desulfomonile tiedjei]|uniref:DUF883 domain-containing protein n=1 Tax=Desulfomonile tiedjei (strain ATCC 49306 / DSM 6799 / DCB-1) TaxID=706587 RepID=I4C3E7_DESTA|nr:hypothetical protein [Desulfomonile tiedjei]AFM24088.1 hypothetical protein Desti_1376 [Desulfomonile tiedjei DSM 6799]